MKKVQIETVAVVRRKTVKIGARREEEAKKKKDCKIQGVRA